MYSMWLYNAGPLCLYRLLLLIYPHRLAQDLDAWRRNTSRHWSSSIDAVCYQTGAMGKNLTSHTCGAVDIYQVLNIFTVGRDMLEPRLYVKCVRGSCE